MTTWTKSTIETSAGTTTSYVRGVWAIHRSTVRDFEGTSKFYKTWVIRHLPSGIELFPSRPAASKGMATSIVDAICAKHPAFENETDYPTAKTFSSGSIKHWIHVVKVAARNLKK